MIRSIVVSDKSIESKPRVTLSNGRVIAHHPLPGGAHEACPMDGGAMTDEEWSEYCEVTIANSRKP